MLALRGVESLDIRPVNSSAHKIHEHSNHFYESSSLEEAPREAVESFQASQSPEALCEIPDSSAAEKEKNTETRPVDGKCVKKEPVEAPVRDKSFPTCIVMEDHSPAVHEGRRRRTSLSVPVFSSRPESPQDSNEQRKLVWEAADSFGEEVHHRRKVTDEFRHRTELFRAVVKAAKEGNRAAIEKLKNKWGYTPGTLPSEGTLFVDPYIMRNGLSHGRINAALYPGTIPEGAARPPLEERLFGNSGKITIPDGKGEMVTISSMKDYREIVKASRAEALHLIDDDGTPKEVNFAFRGEGGKGKRYGAALSELFRLGIVPASASGASSGSIAAALVACGADPETFQRVVQDKRLSELMDGRGPGGVAKGIVAYEFFDEVFREITGIHDRPVTFADLKMPLTIIGAKYSDSAPPPGTEELSTPESRKFIFSKETTPHTPVALAVRTSISIPGLFVPVEVVDPMTGRTIALIDGGVLEDLPLNYGDKDKSTVALHALKPAGSPPEKQKKPLLSFPDGQIYGKSILRNLYTGISMYVGGREVPRDYQTVTNPPDNTFIVSLPVWDLENPSEKNTTLSFAYDPELDPRLDRQTTSVIDRFFAQHIQKLGVAGEKATNIGPTQKDISFEREFKAGSKTWKATYDGGRTVHLASDDGIERFIKVKKRKIEKWLIEDAAFGNLADNLKNAMTGRFLPPDHPLMSKANQIDPPRNDL